MRSFLILCAVVSGLAALLFGATGMTAPGFARLTQMSMAASSFGSLVLCSFGAAVLDLLDKHRAQLARAVDVLERMEQRLAMPVPAASAPTIVEPAEVSTRPQGTTVYSGGRPVIQPRPVRPAVGQDRQDPQV